MKKTLFLIAILGLVFNLSFAAQAGAQAKPLIQLALLLDTSNSMDGLIDQAKSQLWRIVNELATSARDGQRPQLQVALFEYGNDSLSSSDGHIRLVVPLSADLDKISEELFKLKTNGGYEFCGQVIDRAGRALNWSAGSRDLKLIFIAGNEPFTQGSVDYRSSCKEAIGRGIVVNTIFCGNLQEGVNTKWKDGADLADGRYFAIDQNQKVAAIPAPQDAEIASLGAELNKTYLAYGRVGEAGKARQQEQDLNAGSVNPSVATQRSVAKASAQYQNTEWDLVDAKTEGKLKVAEMKDEDLPAEMRKMTPQEREAYVDAMAKRRQEIQKKIVTLNGEREKFIVGKLKAQGLDNTLDSAILSAIRELAGKKNFRFEK